MVEAVSLNQLIGFAEDFNPGAENGLSVLAAFAQSTITGVSSVELAKRLATINSGRSRKSPSPAELEALNFQKTPSYDTAARYLEVCHTMNGTRVFRPALLFSGIESLRSAHQKGVTLKEDKKWLESVYIVLEGEELKIKFLQSDDIYSKISVLRKSS